MRSVAVLIAVLFGMFWFGCSYRIDAPVRTTNAQEPLNEAGHWRRTAAGWQHTSQWRLPTPSRPPKPPAAVYCLSVAAMQLLISGGALVAFSGRREMRGLRIAPVCPQLRHTQKRRI